MTALPRAGSVLLAWDTQPQRQPVEQPPPVWRPPPEPAARPHRHRYIRWRPLAGVPAVGAALVQETQNGGQSRDLIPMVEGQLRQIDQQYRQQSQTLERSCYEYFLFSKTLRNTRKCVDLSREVEGLKSQKSRPRKSAQPADLLVGRSYTDEIIRELARNNCGATYQQQARHTSRIRSSRSGRKIAAAAAAVSAALSRTCPMPPIVRSAFACATAITSGELLDTA